MSQGPEDDYKSSPLYSEDLAPVPQQKRTWNTWHITALWVGMAVCIPTYLLASYMIRDGLGWVESLLIIGLANVIITIPMVLNGHAGVKYGIPFPVVGRAAFGTNGIHIPSLLRGIVACGWFGVQTWVGGLAIHSIIIAITGWENKPGVDALELFSFLVFWVINMFFILRGTESIKWLEEYSAPVLILMGVALIGWGAYNAGGFGVVLKQSQVLGKTSANLTNEPEGKMLHIHSMKGRDGITPKADAFQVITERGDQSRESKWISYRADTVMPLGPLTNADISDHLKIRFRKTIEGKEVVSTPVKLLTAGSGEKTMGQKIWSWILWLTAMVGFWATMSISISDITRFAKTQKAQVRGQFLGLPGTMMLYSFVGIFVTCAATLNFDDVLIAEDAPWDPVTLLSRFKSPWVVIVSQLFMLIATLSTNIAANVIAPANAFSNLFPKKISFKMGGLITGLIGIVILPWKLMDSISSALIFISGLLGPVLGILICDYFLIRKKQLNLAGLFSQQGEFTYSSGFNLKALASMAAGMAVALVGFFVPQVEFLYSLSWFTGFAASFILYYILMPKQVKH